MGLSLVSMSEVLAIEPSSDRGQAIVIRYVRSDKDPKKTAEFIEKTLFSLADPQTSVFFGNKASPLYSP